MTGGVIMESADVTDIYNYIRIDETLATSGQPSIAELGAIAKDGVEVVINLALHDDPRYSLPDEVGTVESLGMKYVHIPVQFDAPTEQDLRAFFTAMEKHEGKKMLVHCAANKRVTSFLGLYRVMRQGWNVDRAFAPMNQVWEPNENWAPFIAAMLAQADRFRP
jgi:protein tyrosine phosphatase (PTP) superfamily phosphohydrolase (DUF442 family)